MITLSMLLFGEKLIASLIVVKFPDPSAATVSTWPGSYSSPELSRIRLAFLESHRGKASSLLFPPPLLCFPPSMDSEFLTCISMLERDWSSGAFSGPVAESRPSKHVILLVMAALRKARASASFVESAAGSREMDFFREDNVIWWSSRQSWMAPRCFSTRLDAAAVERREERWAPWDRAEERDWRRRERMLGEMLMERETLRDSKQAFGCGEDWQTWLSCVELGLRPEIVEIERKRKRMRDLREVEAMEEA